MTTLLTILHVIFCVFLILVILLQTGKGAGMGAAFGGSSSTVFGPRGAGSFIGKATGVVAVLFMLTSLSLAFFSSTDSSSLEQKAALANEKGSGTEVDLDEVLGKSEEAADEKPEEAKPETEEAPSAQAPDASPTATATSSDASPAPSETP